MKVKYFYARLCFPGPPGHLVLVVPPGIRDPPYFEPPSIRIRLRLRVMPHFLPLPVAELAPLGRRLISQTQAPWWGALSLGGYLEDQCGWSDFQTLRCDRRGETPRQPRRLLTRRGEPSFHAGDDRVMCSHFTAWVDAEAQGSAHSSLDTATKRLMSTQLQLTF